MDKEYACRRDSGSVQMTLHFTEFVHILENRFSVGTFGNVSAYKSLNIYFIPFFLKFYGGMSQKIDVFVGDKAIRKINP